MAVNATEVLYLTSGLFKAVPSKAVLTDLVKFNGNIEGLAASLGTSPYAVNAFPFSNAEKAKTLAENLLGSSVAADAKAAATTALEGVLNANGGNVGIAAVVAIKEILKGGTYADAKAQLENRVKVATAYVDSARGTEISNSILNEVTKDAATVTAAIEKLNSNNTPGSDYAGTPNDDTVSLLGGLASTIKIEGGQQGAAGDTLVITAQASATANVINLQNFADQNQTLDAQQRKVSPIIQGFENVDATGSTTEMNITGRDRTSELNTGSVASTQTGSVLKGGAYRDTVTGAAGADSIEGNAGNDVLSGGAGNDTIKGGADNDSITGGTGNDTIEDGTGNDTVSGGADNDTITIGGGVDLINGDDGNDTISFAKDAAAGTSATVRTTVNGGAGNDTIDNTNATATSFLQVSGGANNDKITLGVATENINAGANNDIIVIKQAALDQVGTVAAGDLDVLNGNDGQDALQLLLTSGDATTTFRLTPVNGQYSGFEVIELIDESGNTNAKTYKIDLTDDFVANNFVNGQFLIDARGLPAGSNLVIDTSALTAASAARFATGAFQVWTSPSTDIRDQLNKTIDANYLINASNTALTATRAFYTNASDTTNKAGVHDATTGLITTAPTGATAYTVIGGTAETTTGGSTGGNTFTLTAAGAILTNALASGASLTSGTGPALSAAADTITAINTAATGPLNGSIISDAVAGDGDVANVTMSVAPTTAATWTNIETLNVTTYGQNFTLTGSTGYNRVSLSGNGTINVGNVVNGATFALNSAAQGLTLAVAADTTTNTATLELNGIAAGTVQTGTGNTDDIDQLTIVSQGAAANSFTLGNSFVDAATESITVQGAQNLTIITTSAQVTGGVVNAAANTGVVTIQDTTNAGVAAIDAANFTGVDRILLGDAATDVAVQAGGTAINNLESGSVVAIFGDVGNASDNLTITARGVATNDTVTVDFSTRATALTAAPEIIFSGVENLRVVTGPAGITTTIDNFTTTTTGSTVTVSGAGNLTMSNAFSANISTFDGSAVTGVITMTTGTGVNSVALGSGADVVTIGDQTSNAVSVSAGRGADAITFTAGDVVTFNLTATALTGGDIEGVAETLTNFAAGDMINFTSQVEALLFIGGTALSALTANTALTNTFSTTPGAVTNIRYVDGTDLVQIDINGNGVYDAGTDYQVTIAGTVNSVTYQAATDVFLLA